jgi:sensor histidine kinase YesM
VPVHIGAIKVFLYEFHINALLYAAVLFVGYYLESRRKLAMREAESARLSEELTRAQLEALRQQLEPHFLFNTMNAIAGLVREQRNRDAVTMIARLSDLLRHVLAGTGQQMVSLRSELELLEKYLDIQKMRFAEKLAVSIEVSDDLLELMVPSLIFQPMVENAIQHGIAKQVAGGVIRIRITRAGNLLEISICNNGPRLPVVGEVTNIGIGIANVRNRLKTLYGEGHVFEVRNCLEGVGVEARFVLPPLAKAA